VFDAASVFSKVSLRGVPIHRDDAAILILHSQFWFLFPLILAPLLLYTSRNPSTPLGTGSVFNRFLRSAPVSVFDRRHGGFGRNDLYFFLHRTLDAGCLILAGLSF
jgi:hypothetical protein